jgi:hypothetical protein
MVGSTNSMLVSLGAALTAVSAASVRLGLQQRCSSHKLPRFKLGCERIRKRCRCARDATRHKLACDPATTRGPSGGLDSRGMPQHRGPEDGELWWIEARFDTEAGLRDGAGWAVVIARSAREARLLAQTAIRGEWERSTAEALPLDRDAWSYARVKRCDPHRVRPIAAHVERHRRDSSGAASAEMVDVEGWIDDANVVPFFWAVAAASGSRFDDVDAEAVTTAYRTGSVSYPIAELVSVTASKELGTEVATVSVRAPESFRPAIEAGIAIMQEYRLMRG